MKRMARLPTMFRTEIVVSTTFMLSGPLTIGSCQRAIAISETVMICMNIDTYIRKTVAPANLHASRNLSWMNIRA